MANKIRVLVVDDSAFMRKVVSDILNSSDDITVISTARDGADALRKVAALKPDVVTLDLEMPVMDGLSCLKEIQKTLNTPVIMLSGHTHEGAQATIDALQAGAIDFVTKPTGLMGMSGEEKKQELIAKVKIAKGASRLAGSALESIDTRKRAGTDSLKSSNMKCVVAIGVSTGGPKALQEVIPYIPGSIPAAIIIVQHMPPGFTKSLAERLDSISDLTVREAENGDILKPGYAYVAPGDFQMLVKDAEDGGLKIVLSKDLPVGGHRPAVNVMMNSLTETSFPRLVGVIMTGMGSDGSEGIKNIKARKKGYIIAQDEKSCVVYGMPKSAVQTGVVDSVVPLRSIADEIVKNLGV